MVQGFGDFGKEPQLRTMGFPSNRSTSITGRSALLIANKAEPLAKLVVDVDQRWWQQRA